VHDERQSVKVIADDFFAAEMYLALRLVAPELRSTYYKQSEVMILFLFTSDTTGLIAY